MLARVGQEPPLLLVPVGTQAGAFFVARQDHRPFGLINPAALLPPNTSAPNQSGNVTCR